MTDHAYPDYLVVGAMKAATTTIFDLICEHPKAVKPKFKEIHFFSRNYVRHLSDDLFRYEYHEALNFDSKNPDLLYGEASPSYTLVAKRIFAFNPNCKIIACLRNPADRAISQYFQYKKFGLDKRPIEEALLPPENSNYARDSLYARWLKQYLDVFPERQICLISFEHFVRHTGEAMRDVYDFLGLEKYDPPQGRHSNQGDYERALTGPTLEALERYFAPSRGEVAELVRDRPLRLIPADIGAFLEY